MDKQIAAIYVRVSTEEQAQEGYSIPAQIETLQNYCNLFSIKVYHIYKDLGISGKDTVSRPGLQEMLKDSRKGLFNSVIVWKISRLSRSLKDLLVLLDSFEQRGIGLISYSEKFDTSTPVGRMTLQLLGSIAEFERNTIVENVKLGLHQVAKQGRRTGGVVFGYKTEDGHLTVIEEEAAIVRRIFDMYVREQLGLTAIAKRLNAEGYKTKRGKRFAKDGVGSILSNPVYIGINRFKTKRKDKAKYFEVPGTHEHIIDKDIFEEAQLRRKARAEFTAKRHETSPFLLAGLISCPVCGRAMVSSYSHSYKKLKDGSKLKYRYRYYKCNGWDRHRDDSCPIRYASAERLENEVFNYIANLVSNPQTIEKVLKVKTKEYEVSKENLVAQLNDIDKQLNEKQQAREKYFRLFESGELNNTSLLIERLNEIESQIEILNNRKKQLDSEIEFAEDSPANSSDIIDTLKNFTELYKVATPLEKRELMQVFISKVQLTKEKPHKIEALEFKFGVRNKRINF